MIKLLKAIYKRTLSSVAFGICLMVLVALYVAIGSGLAWVREAFEMNEMLFFSAWPLRLLVALLVLNLSVVTFTRIPFTPPRYGVWCIHAGIITLILGMSAHYRHKVEGMVRLWVDAREGPVTQDHFYDSFERALYVRMNNTLWNWYPLPALPRFKEYDGEHRHLTSAALRDIRPRVTVRQPSGELRTQTLAEMYGLRDLRIDITGYWPYAHIATDFAEDPSGINAIRLNLADEIPAAMELGDAWLIGADGRHAWTIVDGHELEHKHRPADIAEAMRHAARHLHRVNVRIGERHQTIFVDPGRSYSLDDDYAITVESYQPAWPMFGTGQIVRALTLRVKSPAGEFRRMILDGHDLQTDFIMDAPDAGPMGKRQAEPLDRNITLQYTLTDPFRLLPSQGIVKHTLLTEQNSRALYEIVAGIAQPSEVRAFADGAGIVEITHDDTPHAMFLAARDHAPHPPLRLRVQHTNVRRDDRVEVVPPEKRTRDFGEAGVFQIVRARVHAGDWSQDVLVPFSQDAWESRWDGAIVQIPYTDVTLQLQLGNTRRPLPAVLTLENFEVIPYRGGEVGPGNMMREFRSTVSVHDPRSGQTYTDAAYMNSPIYFDRGKWLFFQAAYDGQDQRWTALGVGNRPHVTVMTAGCIMIVGGLLYAFYLKPIIIRRMKAAALARNGIRDASRNSRKPGPSTLAETPA